MKIAVLSITLAVFVALLLGSAVWVYINPSEDASLTHHTTTGSKEEEKASSPAAPQPSPEDGRRFIDPTITTNARQQADGDMTAVDYVWPVTNKKLAKHILDQLSIRRIPHRLDPSTNTLFVDFPNPDDIKQFCRFHEKTINHSYTHFISLPVFHDERLSNEVKVLHDDAEELISLPKRFHNGNLTHAFTDPHKLHLTVCMLTLLSEADLERAKSIIDEYCADLKPFTVSLKGVDVLKGTAEACRVLVANINNEPELSPFHNLCRLLLQHQLSDSLPPIRWHCTLINAKYYEQHYDTHNCSFDARKLLRKTTAFSKPVEVQIYQVHLSCLHHGHRRHQSTDEYYHAAHIRTL